MEDVRAWLRWPADETPRLAALPAPRYAFALPPAGDALATLLRMDVPPGAAAEMVEAMPSPDADPEAWWLLERLYTAVVDGGPAPPWPAPVVEAPALTRFFHLYVFLGAVPAVLRAQGAREISPDITWDTLQDVGLQVAHYQSRYGSNGFDGAFWVWQHFQADVFRLGRLLFEPSTVEVDGASVDALGVHIPALGPLTPEACDDAFARADRFFRRHFPERALRIAACRSWLMDDQLVDYLDPASNIVRFQRRFEIQRSWSRPGNEDVIRFVFGAVPATLHDLPQRTSLEKAVVEHLRSGGTWYIRLGTFER